MRLIIDISPMREVFSLHFPECSEKAIASAVMAQVVKTHFQPEQDWLKDNSAELMIEYIDNVFLCGNQAAVNAWRDMVNAFIEKIINVDPVLAGVKHVPKKYQIISDNTIMVEY